MQIGVRAWLGAIVDLDRNDGELRAATARLDCDQPVIVFGARHELHLA
jgi:hypothetical protein